MEYTLVEQVKIRKGQYEVGDDDSIKWTVLQDNPRIEQHIEEIKQEYATSVITHLITQMSK